jgi:putative SOS response-associated peptidase YedK
MCERYVSPDHASLQPELGLVSTGGHFPANFNVGPSALAAVIPGNTARREYVFMRFGIGSRFAKDKLRTLGAVNAGIETLMTSGTFRDPWERGQRCIIPAMGFYEWHVNADGSKQPYFIHVNDQDVFGFAGLWARFTHDENTVTESFAIITVPANKMMAEIHNTKMRMPAILTRQQHARWLSAEGDVAASALRPYADELMTAYPVSSLVDSSANNDERLIEPLQTDVD